MRDCTIYTGFEITWDQKNKRGWVWVCGHNVQAIVQAGLPHEERSTYGYNRRTSIYTPRHVVDACEQYLKNQGYGGLSLCAYLKKIFPNDQEVVRVQVNVLTALEMLEQANLGNDRLNTLKAVDSPLLRKYLAYALSPDITFGMKKLPTPSSGKNTPFRDHDDWLVCLFAMLSFMEEDANGKRELSGNAAKDEVSRFLGRCDDTQRKWSERAILQDLKLNIGAKDVNRALGKNTIPVFLIPLAEPFKDLKSTQGKWFIQHKYDGGRCVVELHPDGSVRLRSRTGKEWTNYAFREVRASMEKFNAWLKPKEVMCIDGEIVLIKDGRMDFQGMQRLFFAQDERDLGGDVVYYAFDHATKDEYEEPSRPYSQRFASLVNVFQGYMADNGDLPSNVDMAHVEIVVDPAQAWLEAKSNEFVESFGCDGAIMRRYDAVPRNRKSTDITKVKPFEDGEAPIVGKVEGKKGTWAEGSLGALVCVWPATGKQFEIGTGEGLTQKLRDELFNDPDLTKKWVNFKYQRITNDGVPNLPTFRAIRHPADFRR